MISIPVRWFLFTEQTRVLDCIGCVEDQKGSRFNLLEEIHANFVVKSHLVIKFRTNNRFICIYIYLRKSLSKLNLACEAL